MFFLTEGEHVKWNLHKSIKFIRKGKGVIRKKFFTQIISVKIKGSK